MNPKWVAICVLLLAAVTAGAAGQGKMPHAELSEKSWDFGNIDQGETDQHVIRIRNKGEAPLRIKKVTVTCGCLKATVKEQTVAPGKEIDLFLSLNTSEKFGKIAKQVLIATNDYHHAILSVNVTGFIHKVWWTDPAKINAGNIPQTLEHTGMFRVMTRKDAVITIESVTCSDPRATAMARPFDPKLPSEGWIVDFSLPRNLPLGYYNCRISIKTSGTTVKSQYVDVFGTVHGPLSVSPSRLNFGQVDPKKPKTMRVFVEKTVPGFFSIVSVSSAKKEITVKQVEHEKGRIIELSVTLSQRDGKRFTGGKITIVTTEPTQRRIDIPYVGRFKN